MVRKYKYTSFDLIGCYKLSPFTAVVKMVFDMKEEKGKGFYPAK